MDDNPQAIHIGLPADFTKSGLEWAIALLRDVREVPISIVLPSCGGYMWRNEVAKVLEDYNLPGVWLERRRRLGPDKHDTYPGRSFHTNEHLLAWDAWMLIGHRGSVVWSEGA